MKPDFKIYSALLSLTILFSVAQASSQKDSWTGISTEEFYKTKIPASNPVTDAKIKLGEKLFNEKRISPTGTVSCATCHDPKRAFTDGKSVSEGINGLKGKRNSPTAMNALFQDIQFWDGRAPSLEEQAKLPILNPVEMGVKTPEEAVQRIRGIPAYAQLFADAFNGSSEITYDKMAMAIASFERTLVSKPAPFDRFLAGDLKAISPAAQRGWSTFNGRGRCVTCHAVNPTWPLFSDGKFHNIGVAAKNANFSDLAKEAMGIVEKGNKEQIDNLAIESKFSDLGRFLVTKSRGDIGAFKTPSLRNIAVTAPYMHDGSFTTLWDVVDHYNKGGITNPFIDGGITRLALSEAEINDLVELMTTFTSPEFEPLAKTELAKMRALKGKRPQRDTKLAFGKTGDNSDAVLVQDMKNPAQVGGY
jgi:cytochrome c peroxidase